MPFFNIARRQTSNLKEAFLLAPRSFFPNATAPGVLSIAPAMAEGGNVELALARPVMLPRSLSRRTMLGEPARHPHRIFGLSVHRARPKPRERHVDGGIGLVAAVTCR